MELRYPKNNFFGYKSIQKFTIFIFISIFIYNFIYPIRLSLIPGSEIVLYLLIFPALIFNYLAFKRLLSSKSFLSLVACLVFLLMLGIISFILNGSNDILQFIMIVKYTFALFLSSLISIIILKNFKENSLNFLLNIIVISGFLITITCLLEFFSPASKMFFANTIDTSGNIVYEDSFRVHGLASGGGASLSVGLMVTSLVSFLLFKNKSGFTSYLYLVSSLFIYISLILVGRTGFFILSLFYMIYFFRSLSVASLFIPLSLSSIIYYLYHILSESQLNIIYGYGLEPLKNFIENGEIATKTTSQLANMYYLPDTLHFILGAGFWRYPNHGYILSDVGYIKVLMSFGIFGFIIFYLLQLFIYTKAYIYYIKLFRERLILFFIFFSLFIVEFKEAFFAQNYAFKILILLFTFQFVKKNLFKDLNLKI